MMMTMMLLGWPPSVAAAAAAAANSYVASQQPVPQERWKPRRVLDDDDTSFVQNTLLAALADTFSTATQRFPVENPLFDTISELMQQLDGSVEMLLSCPLLLSNDDKLAWQNYWQHQQQSLILDSTRNEMFQYKVDEFGEITGTTSTTMETDALCPLWRHFLVDPTLVNFNVASLLPSMMILQQLQADSQPPWTFPVTLVGKLFSFESTGSDYVLRVYPIQEEEETKGLAVALVSDEDISSDGDDLPMQQLLSESLVQAYGQISSSFPESWAILAQAYRRLLLRGGEPADFLVCTVVAPDQVDAWNEVFGMETDGLAPSTRIQCPLVHDTATAAATSRSDSTGRMMIGKNTDLLALVPALDVFGVDSSNTKDSFVEVVARMTDAPGFARDELWQVFPVRTSNTTTALVIAASLYQKATPPPTGDTSNIIFTLPPSKPTLSPTVRILDDDTTATPPGPEITDPQLSDNGSPPSVVEGDAEDSNNLADSNGTHLEPTNGTNSSSTTSPGFAIKASASVPCLKTLFVFALPLFLAVHMVLD